MLLSTFAVAVLLVGEVAATSAPLSASDPGVARLGPRRGLKLYTDDKELDKRYVIGDRENRSLSVVPEAWTRPAPADHSQHWITAPWETAWNNSIAFCMIVKNEAPSDLREFLQYHQWLGVDHVYLHENDSAEPVQNAIVDFIESGFVTYKSVPGTGMQDPVYRSCDVNYRHKWNWIMYVDADEFLHVRNPGMSLKGLLEQYKAFAGLGVHWIMMGPSERETRPVGGGMMRAYDKCQAFPHEHLKTIVNSYFVEEVLHPHNQHYRGEATAVNEGRWPMERHLLPEHNALIQRCLEAHPDDPNACAATRVGISEYVPFNIWTPERRTANTIALFHYVTKSRQDFQSKVDRGSAKTGSAKSIRSWDQFDFWERETSRQSPLCHELVNLADICCPR